MIQQRFRSDYPGEFVVLETKWSGGRKHQKREWIPNPIENHHISGRAAVIGTTIDQDKFDFTRLQKHKGGLLGKKRLQTYVTNGVWQSMRADFSVETDIDVLKSIVESKYNDSNIVYTIAKNCLALPGEFYLIPFAPAIDILALPIYIAAFDGHKEIFMLGYNQELSSGNKNWVNHIDLIFSAYSSTKFYLIGVESNMPTVWKNHLNVECMKYRDFVTYCDV